MNPTASFLDLKRAAREVNQYAGQQVAIAQEVESVACHVAGEDLHLRDQSKVETEWQGDDEPKRPPEQPR